jgi:cardiolipin synthase (CMP-forming)
MMSPSMGTAGAPKSDESDLIWTIPNLISAARLLLVPAFIWAFLVEANVLGVVLLVVIGTTDWVDGFVARRLGQVSELGKLLDPLADRIAIVAVLVVFTVRGVLPPVLAGVLLLRDLLVAIAFPVLEAKGMERIPVNMTGKMATASIFVGLAVLAVELASPKGLASVAHVAGLAFLVLGAVLYWVATFLYVGEIRRRLPAARGR